MLLGVVLLGGGFYLFNSYIYNEKQAVVGESPQNAEYIIDGKRVILKDGVSEVAEDEVTTTTRYFGNELETDLDGDGRMDMVFLVTQDMGGSGTFYYAVGAVNTEEGYRGTDGYFLGDRIAPQSTDLSPNPRHKNVIVVNYADRAPGEPFTTQPSIGESAYLKLVPEYLQWAIVEPDFEGESR